MAIVVQGFTADSKTPGAVAELQFAQGPLSAGAVPRFVLLYGNKLSSGASAADNEVADLLSQDEARAFAGAGSELGRMAVKALAVPGVKLRAVAVPEASGGTAATLTITITGTWSTGGSIDIHMGGRIVNVAAAPTDTPTTMGDRVVSRLTEDPDLYCNPVNAAGVVTCTVKNLGVRGNDHIVHVVDKLRPAGMTVALGGGTPLANGGVPFSGGAGADDVTAALAATFSGSSSYVGAAQNDATNAALLVTQANNKAGPLEGRYENPVFALNGTLAAANSFSQTTLNNAFCQCLLFEGSRNHPSEIAAVWAALRSVTEALPVSPQLGNPNHRYDGTALPGILPHFLDSDVPTRSETDSALNSGVSPIGTKNGTAVMVRSITSRSLNGATPDYRTLDTGDAVVPQRGAEHFNAKWETDHAQVNQYVGPDPLNGAAPPVGFSTPSAWRAQVLLDLRLFATQNMVTDVDNNLPVVEYDSAGKRLMSSIPMKVTPQNHQTGSLIRQIPS
jgi:phage tail sheath gpL-like